MNDITSNLARPEWGSRTNWLTALLALAIAVSTLWPIPSLPGPSGADKTMHLFAFAALVLPMAVLRPRGLIWLIPAAILLGGLIEIIQPFVGRSREFLDFVADAIGVGLGSLAGLAFGFGLRNA